MTSHNPSLSFLVPVKRIILFLYTFIDVLSNVMVQSSSHNWPNDNKDEFFSQGNMLALLASLFTDIIGNKPVLEIVIVSLFGNITLRLDVSDLIVAST